MKKLHWMVMAAVMVAMVVGIAGFAYSEDTAAPAANTACPKFVDNNKDGVCDSAAVHHKDGKCSGACMAAGAKCDTTKCQMHKAGAAACPGHMQSTDSVKTTGTSTTTSSTCPAALDASCKKSCKSSCGSGKK